MSTVNNDPLRDVSQTNKNGLTGWHFYKDSFIEGGVSVSELVAHLHCNGEC